MTGEIHQQVLRGLTTAWWEGGIDNAPLLFFVHGYPDSPETWEHQLQYFEKRFHLVAPYVRGAGPSAASSDVRRYGNDALSLDWLQLLATLDPERRKPIVLIGHDLGAVHVWSLALLLGRQVAGVILINGLGMETMMGRLSMLRQHRRSWYIYGMQLPWIPETLIRIFPREMLGLAHRLGKLPESARLPLDSLEDCLVGTVPQYRAFVRDIPARRKRRHPRLRCPLLVLWGREDSFLVTPRAEEWDGFAQDVTTRILPAGHWVHRERSKEVNRLIDKFLAEKVFVRTKERTA